jgi:predicted metal-dependent phosphoesterase TrpH
MEIKFSKPNPSKLASEGLACVDMHFHTMYSDGAAKIKEILKKLDKDKIGVAITDHNAIGGAISIMEKKKDQFVIPGIEVKVKGSVDILFYFHDKNELTEFYNKEIKNHTKMPWVFSEVQRSMEEMADISRGYNCLASLAHPEKNPHDIALSGYKRFPAIEVMNGGISHDKNVKASSFADKLKKAATAGSDGHSIYELGNVVTVSDDKEDFLESIMKRKNKLIGTELSFGTGERVALHIKNRITNLWT